MSSAVNDLGPESLLGPDAEELDGQEARDRLALATRYLANWYRAVAGSPNKAVWVQRIDVERRKVEDAYKAASGPLDELFLGRDARAAYKEAAKDWPQLWRDLSLNADDLIDTGLLGKAADALSTLTTAPFLILPTLGNEAGKAIGGAIGNFVRQTFPWLLLGGGVVLAYVFRAPLAAVAKEVTS